MKKTLCLAAALALSGSLAAAQTPAPAPVATQAAAAAAAAHPSLTGTWNLNVAKSNFDQIPPPTSEILTFTQSDSHFTLAVKSDSDRGKENYTLPFNTDGPETPVPGNTFPESADLHILSARGEWQGSSLILTEKTTYQGNPGAIKSTFTVSPDGKTLTRVMNISFDQGGFETTSVFDKQ